MDLVYESRNQLDSIFCDKVIEKFKADSRKKMDSLHISRFIEWEDTVDILDDFLKIGIEEYKKFVSDQIGTEISYLNELKHSEGYIIKKIYETDWHSDFLKNKSDSRTITVLWYLNTRNFDGETDFIFKKIKPEKGKLIMFPSSWNSIYKDHPSDDKYVIISWLFNDK